MSAHPFARSGAMLKACKTLRLDRPPPTKKELKKRFLTLAHESHPDKQRATSGDSKASNDRMFALTDAYKTLSPLYDAPAKREQHQGVSTGDPSDPASWAAMDPAACAAAFTEPDRGGRVWMPWCKNKPGAVRQWEDRNGRSSLGGASLFGSFAEAPNNAKRETRASSATDAHEKRKVADARATEAAAAAASPVGRLRAWAAGAPRRWLAAARYVLYS